MGQSKQRKKAGKYPTIPKLKKDADADFIIASLHQAAKIGHVTMIESHIGDVIRVAPIKPFEARQIPTFDFGHMSDPEHPDCIGKPATDECFRQAFDMFGRGSFRLPFPESVFVFRFSETQHQYDRVNVVVCIEDDECVRGYAFSKSIVNGSTNHPWIEKWRWEPIMFLLKGHECGLMLSSPNIRLDDYNLSEYEADARAGYTNVMVATMLLNRRAVTLEVPRTTSDHTATTPSVASSRATIPIRRVLYNRVEIKRIGDEGIGKGAPKRPHERRGHYRTLRDGRVIPVSSSKIRGGSNDPLFYQAESDAVANT